MKIIITVSKKSNLSFISHYIKRGRKGYESAGFGLTIITIYLWAERIVIKWTLVMSFRVPILDSDVLLRQKLYYLKTLFYFSWTKTSLYSCV